MREKFKFFFSEIQNFLLFQFSLFIRLNQTKMLKTLQFLIGAFCCSDYFILRPVQQPKVVSQRNFIDPHFLPNHYGIVQLFEWKWLDIAKECEEFLGPKKFGGVQVGY